MAMVSPVQLLIATALCLCCTLFGAGEAARGAAASAFHNRATDPNMEVKFDFSPFLIQYKSGRVQRFMGTTFVLASMDSRTRVASRDVIMDNQKGLAVRLYQPSHCAMASGGRRLPVLVYFHADHGKVTRGCCVVRIEGEG